MKDRIVIWQMNWIQIRVHQLTNFRVHHSNVLFYYLALHSEADVHSFDASTDRESGHAVPLPCYGAKTS